VSPVAFFVLRVPLGQFFFNLNFFYPLFDDFVASMKDALCFLSFLVRGAFFPLVLYFFFCLKPIASSGVPFSTATQDDYALVAEAFFSAPLFLPPC